VGSEERPLSGQPLAPAPTNTKPQYCFSTFNAVQKMRLADGTALTPALGTGAFCELTLVAAGQCTEVARVRPEAAGLLGCGVMAGLGAVAHTGAVQPGDSVVAFGCGGVGCAAVAGAKLAGATTIVGVDVDSGKLAWPRSLGATHVVDSSTEGPVAAVRAATAGSGRRNS
jgi:S-(hydroxymethyl)mycothiol dehydrogenase